MKQRRGVVLPFAIVFAGCSDGGSTKIDAGDSDAAIDGPIDAPIDAGPLSSDAGDPMMLSTQGVYGVFATRTLPFDAIPYDVNWELWADGATKRRWLILSPGSAPIDNSDQEHWQFPSGARLVKEFTRDGKLVETRIVERLAGAATFSLRTYVWDTNGTDAILDIDGAVDVAGTGHDAPSSAQCMACHNGESGKVLGFSAVQLPAATLTLLSSTSRLSNPIAAGTTFGPTGAAVDVAAMGTLHASCGHCHNPSGVAGTINTLTLRLDAATKPANQEPGWLTSVNIAVQGNGLGATERIDPMMPANSAIVKRMDLRGTGQMPQIATEVIDTAGVTAITAWVNTLTP